MLTSCGIRDRRGKIVKRKKERSMHYEPVKKNWTEKYQQQHSIRSLFFSSEIFKATVIHYIIGFLFSVILSFRCLSSIRFSFFIHILFAVGREKKSVDACTRNIYLYIWLLLLLLIDRSVSGFEFSLLKQQMCMITTRYGLRCVCLSL